MRKAVAVELPPLFCAASLLPHNCGWHLVIIRLRKSLARCIFELLKGFNRIVFGVTGGIKYHKIRYSLISIANLILYASYIYSGDRQNADNKIMSGCIQDKTDAPKQNTARNLISQFASNTQHKRSSRQITLSTYTHPVAYYIIW